MIDIHSHILPGVDDGSRSTEDTLSMLSAMQEQGVEVVAATSHFYANQETLERFLNRRNRAKEKVHSAVSENGTKTPKIIAGAEVWYFDGISRSESLPQLCIEGTGLFLLEMPFETWTDKMIREIISLQESGEFTVLLAHIERYMSMQKRGTLDYLLQNDVLIQANAEAFLERKTAKKVMRMLERQQIHFLGSDCHNLTSRPPNFGSAVKKISETLGAEAIHYLAEMGKQYYQCPEESQ